MQSGADQARQRVAVPSLIEGDRIGFRRLWQIFVDEAARHPAVDAQTLHQITANLYAVEDLFETAKFSGYRDQQRRQALEEMSQRSVMIDSLLHGHNHDAWTLWEIANYLRLPTEGPFVVIAAEVGDVGYEALPEIESKLRSLDVFSAWRLLPDLHVGIAHVASEHHLERVIALLTRMATHRVGVSARFDDLRDTPLGLHFAKVSLRGQATAAAKVAVFDGSMLTTAAVSAPAVMVKSAAAALDGFNDLPDEEREILFETFRVVAGQRRIGARGRRGALRSSQHGAQTATSYRTTHRPIALAPTRCHRTDLGLGSTQPPDVAVSSHGQRRIYWVNRSAICQSRSALSGSST